MTYGNLRDAEGFCLEVTDCMLIRQSFSEAVAGLTCDLWKSERNSSSATGQTSSQHARLVTTACLPPGGDVLTIIPSLGLRCLSIRLYLLRNDGLRCHKVYKFATWYLGRHVTGSRWPFTVRRPMSTVQCPLSTVHCPLSTIHRSIPPSTVHHPQPPSTVYRPLSTVRCPPSSSPPQSLRRVRLHGVVCHAFDDVGDSE